MKSIKKDDEVKVLIGKDKGKTGKVIKVVKDQKIIVEGINIIKKHVKPSQMGPGGIEEMPAPFDISNVMLVCSSCKQATRVDKTKLADGNKVRSCKKCGESVDA